MSRKQKRLLFVLRKRSSYGVSYGLANSCKFICNTLERLGIECKIVEVVDNNRIDAEVHSFKPTHVSIDALWVVPEKFNVLLKKYPKVKWCVRIHSKIPFIANEGIAFDWMYRYQKIANVFNNFTVAANALITNEQLIDLGIKSVYLPNIYDPFFNPADEESRPVVVEQPNSEFLHIGCFGSIRPLKNHFNQATAAVIFANSIGKKLKFHINSDRIEQKGEPIFKNLEKLFENNPNHELVKHPWMNHMDFLKLVKTMDIGMQVSYSESFCIVAADFVYKEVPIIGSPDIEWLADCYKADPNNYKDMVEKLSYAYKNLPTNGHWVNEHQLWKHNVESTEKWVDYVIKD